MYTCIGTFNMQVSNIFFCGHLVKNDITVIRRNAARLEKAEIAARKEEEFRIRNAERKTSIERGIHQIRNEISRMAGDDSDIRRVLKARDIDYKLTCIQKSINDIIKDYERKKSCK